MLSKKFILFICFALLFFVFLLPSRDPDLGWELRCGKLFLENHNLCTPDQFSFLLPGYQWINSEYVYQTLLYKTYQLFAFWGLSLFCAFLLTTSFILLFKSWVAAAKDKIIAIFIISAASWDVFALGIRSQLFSFFFFTLVLFLLSRINKQKHYPLIVLPVVFLLWSNIHGGFLPGLFVYGLFLIESMDIKNIFHSFIIKRYLFFSFFASVLATLINPFGYQVYTNAILHQFFSHLSGQIAEWASPDLLNSLIIIYLFLVAFIPLIRQFSFLNLIRFLGLAIFSLLALSSRRHVPYFYMVFIGYWFSFSGHLFTHKQVFQHDWKYLVIIFASCAGLVFLIKALPNLFKQNSLWSSYCYQTSLSYPCSAVSYLKKNHLNGNIFNRYEWGGFLDWQLPKSKIFVDGRMPTWKYSSGKEPYLTYLYVIQAQPDWQKILSGYHTDILLIEPGTFLDLELTQNHTADWLEVYRDKYSVVYVNQAFAKKHTFL